MAKEKLPRLHKQDDKLGVINYQPGTSAEYHQLRLQGWSDKKPSARQDSTQTGSAAKSDSKK